MEVHGSGIAEAWLGEFWALLYKHVRWVQLCGSLSILWHCLSLGLEWKLTFSSPVATAEFSKFAGILSAALSQHHVSRFEIAQLEFHHLHWLCCWCKINLTGISQDLLLLETLENNLVYCFFQIPEATWILWLKAFSSIFKALSFSGPCFHYVIFFFNCDIPAFFFPL